MASATVMDGVRRRKRDAALKQTFKVAHSKLSDEEMEKGALTLPKCLSVRPLAL